MKNYWLTIASAAISSYLLGLVAPTPTAAEGVNWWIDPTTGKTEELSFGQGGLQRSLILAQAKVQQQSQWQMVSLNEYGDRFFLDTTSVMGGSNPNIVYFRDMMIYSSPEKGISAISSFKSANCSTGQYRSRQITTYDANRKVMDSFTDGDRAPLYTAKSGSSLATVLQSACGVRGR